MFFGEAEWPRVERFSSITQRASSYLNRSPWISNSEELLSKSVSIGRKEKEKEGDDVFVMNDGTRHRIDCRNASKTRGHATINPCMRFHFFFSAKLTALFS